MFALFLKIFLIAAYFYLLSVFKRGKLEFFRFAVGSVGMFILLIQFIDYMKEPVTYLFTEVLGSIGTHIGMFKGYSRYGMFFIDRGNTAMSLYMDLECSGIIEMLVYTSLIFFFPVYKRLKKLIIWAVGIVLIFCFNIIRVFGIIILICSQGSSAYAFAHAIFGRFIFYVCVIILYFFVFTKGQLNKQNVGKFSYEGAGENSFSKKKYESDGSVKEIKEEKEDIVEINTESEEKIIDETT